MDDGEATFSRTTKLELPMPPEDTGLLIDKTILQYAVQGESVTGVNFWRLDTVKARQDGCHPVWEKGASKILCGGAGEAEIRRIQIIPGGWRLLLLATYYS